MRVVRALFPCVILACTQEIGDVPNPPPSAVASAPGVPELRGPFTAKAGLPPALVWTDRSEVFVPRVSPALVDQIDRKRVLVYGGWQENGVRNDTWEWDGLGWIRRFPSRDPGRRAAPAAVYDEERNRVLMTGGASEFWPNPAFADTTTMWEWDGNEWSSFVTAHAPPSALSSATAWDPDGKRMLLFGGLETIVSEVNDRGEVSFESEGTDQFWQFDGFDWKPIPRTEPWPPGRGFSSMSWDRVRHKLILHSGQARAVFYNGSFSFGTKDEPTIARPLADTWEWDGNVWTQVEYTAPTQIGAANTYWDPIAQETRLVLDQLIALGDLRPVLGSFVGGKWIELSKSPVLTPRALTAAVWSSANDGVFVLGGVRLMANGGPSADVALEEGIAGVPAWSMQPLNAQSVATEEAATATEHGGTVVRFGGRSGNAVVGSTLRWTGGRWTDVSPPSGSPTPRRSASMTSLADGRVLMFGGIDEEGDGLAETWIWDSRSSSWTGPLTQADPQPPAWNSATLFRLGDDVYAYGGRWGGADATATWRFRNDRWDDLGIERAAVGGLTCGASDGVRAYVAGGASTFWTFAADAGWQSLEPTTLGFRTGCAMAYSQTLGQVFLMGGSGSEGNADLLQLTPQVAGAATTTSEVRVDQPPRRREATLTDAPVRGALILSGGRRNDNGQQLADTWQLHGLGQSCTASEECGPIAFCNGGLCCEQEACGPCSTCAGSAPGRCTPLPAGPQPGCDGAYACNGDGRCRLGAGQECGDNSACASDACIKAADAGLGLCCELGGCVVQCVEDDTKLRNGDGTLKDCAPYLCEGNSCRDSCASVKDCVGDTVCNGEGKCVPQDTREEGEGSSCGCHVPGATRWSPGALVVAFGALVVGARRRRRV